MATATAAPAATEEVHYRKSPMWRLALANLSQGQAMTFYMLVTYMSYLMSEGYYIETAVAGVVLTFTRIIDGLIDPGLAVLIDSYNPKCGKIRFFTTLGWVIRSLAVLVLFTFCSGKGLGIVFFILLYIVYIVGSSINDIAGNIISNALTNDPKQRPVVGVFGTVYAYFVPMIMTVVITMVLLPMYGNEYNVEMLSMSAIVCIAISGVFQLLSCIGIAAVDKPETYEGTSAASEGNAKISLKDLWALLKGNRPFQMYLLSSVSAQLANNTKSQSIIGTMLWGILVGNMQFGTMLSVISMLPSIVFAIIGAKHTGKVGAKKANVIWSIAMAVSLGILAVFFGAIDMTLINTNTVIKIVAFVLLLATSATSMCVTTSTTAMRSDVVDFELARSGNFMAGSVCAAYNFINQVVTSLGTTIASVSVAAVGYVTTMPQPTDPATPAIKAVTIFLYCIIPVIGALIGLIAMKFYELDKEKMEEVQLTIQEKREALHEAEGDEVAAMVVAEAHDTFGNPTTATAAAARMTYEEKIAPASQE